MNYYSYDELRAEAIRTESREACRALAMWLMEYDPGSWNGEYFDIDGGRMLWPVVDDPGDCDDPKYLPLYNFVIR